MTQASHNDPSQTMSPPADALREQVVAFGAHYEYDVGYLSELLDASRPAFDAYLGAQPMSGTRSSLPLDAHYVARISTMQQEDCGACAQLNIRMAFEAGVDGDLVRALVHDPSSLAPALSDVRALAVAVCTQAVVEPELIERLRGAYGKSGLAELAVAIAGSRVFPSLKKALGHGGVCHKLDLEV